MKRITKQVTILAGLCAAACWGQNTYPWPSSGNVGVGTTSPRNYGSPAYNTVAVDGTTSGVFNVQANGSTVLVLYGDSAAGYIDNGGRPLPLVFRVDGEKMRITANGNVGVGTASPAYKLDVQGSIGAQDIYVASGALPDYVFDADYRNAPLSEVAAYIDENHHLPGMPSAADAGKNRLSVGDMQNKLLQKVEELTLHMIAAEKRSEELAQSNGQLAQQNRELQERVAQLEAKGEGK